MFTKGLVKCHATLKFYSTIKTAIWTEYKTVLLLLGFDVLVALLIVDLFYVIK